MSTDADSVQSILQELNEALAWEMRAQVMYSHFGSYVKGIHRLHLKPFFEGEAAESVIHGQTVRDQIVKLGGVATTNRDPAEIVHTTDYKVMLGEAYKTETQAAATYKKILALPGLDAELSDTIEQISFEEQRSIE
jgi:bacterioferritin (cytochrome b1)